MWRTRAVKSMLLQEIAGLRGDPEGQEGGGESALTRARRRALLVAVVDWAAILVLLFTRGSREPFLPTGASTETVFTVGILVVATHAGFRLGQLEKYAAVARLRAELTERDPEP